MISACAGPHGGPPGEEGTPKNKHPPAAPPPPPPSPTVHSIPDWPPSRSSAMRQISVAMLSSCTGCHPERSEGSSIPTTVVWERRFLASLGMTVEELGMTVEELGLTVEELGLTTDRMAPQLELRPCHRHQHAQPAL